MSLFSPEGRRGGFSWPNIKRGLLLLLLLLHLLLLLFALFVIGHGPIHTCISLTTTGCSLNLPICYFFFFFAGNTCFRVGRRCMQHCFFFRKRAFLPFRRCLTNTSCCSANFSVSVRRRKAFLCVASLVWG